MAAMKTIKPNRYFNIDSLTKLRYVIRSAYIK